MFLKNFRKIRSVKLPGLPVSVVGAVAFLLATSLFTYAATATLSLNVTTGPSNQSQTILGLGVLGGSQQLGSGSILPAGTPAAPTVTNVGTAGSTSRTYYCVGRDINNLDTINSSSTVNTTGNGTLTAANYNNIYCAGEAGVTEILFLKTDTNTLLGTCYVAPGEGCAIKDTGQATSTYTSTNAVGVAATGAQTVDQTGMLLAAQACAGSVTVTAGSVLITAPCASKFTIFGCSVQSPVPPVAGDVCAAVGTSTATVIASATVTVGAVNVQSVGTPSPSPIVNWWAIR